MFKPGHIWDRVHRSGVHQIGVIIESMYRRETSGEVVNYYKVFIISGVKAGERTVWREDTMRVALSEGRMSMLA